MRNPPAFPTTVLTGPQPGEDFEQWAHRFASDLELIIQRQRTIHADYLEIRALLRDINARMQAGTYTPSNVTTTRTFDADSTSVAELADVLGTLLADLNMD